MEPRHLLFAALALIIIVPAQADDAVSIAVAAVTDIYVRPLHLTNVVFEVRTDYFEPGTTPSAIFLVILPTTTCCVPTPGAVPLLEFSVFVEDGRLRNVSASGQLIDRPTGRSLAQPVDVEREVLAAISKYAKARVSQAGTRVVNGRTVRRFVFKDANRRFDSNRFIVVDDRSRLAKLIEL